MAVTGMLLVLGSSEKNADPVACGATMTVPASCAVFGVDARRCAIAASRGRTMLRGSAADSAPCRSCASARHAALSP